MNAITLYTWDDAPHSLRELMKPMVPKDYRPIWISHAMKQSKVPTYLLLFLTKAWIDSMLGDWNKVFFVEHEGGEVRLGVEKKRGSP